MLFLFGIAFCSACGILYKRSKQFPYVIAVRKYVLVVCIKPKSAPYIFFRSRFPGSPPFFPQPRIPASFTHTHTYTLFSSPFSCVTSSSNAGSLHEQQSSVSRVRDPVFQSLRASTINAFSGRGDGVMTTSTLINRNIVLPELGFLRFLEKKWRTC